MVFVDRTNKVIPYPLHENALVPYHAHTNNTVI